MFSSITKSIYGLLTAAFFLSLFSPYVYAAEPSVARATFTSGIKNREPINRLTTANQSIPKIYFFTEIQNYSGKSVTHRWIYNSWVVQQVPFRVNSHSWRTYSAKTLLPEKGLTGDWKVEVLDDNGKVIGEQHFTYVCQGYCPKEEVKKPKKKVRVKKKSRKLVKVKKKSPSKKIKKKEPRSNIVTKIKPVEQSENKVENTTSPTSESDKDTVASPATTSTNSVATTEPASESKKIDSVEQAAQVESTQSIGQGVQSELRSVIQEAKEDMLFE